MKKNTTGGYCVYIYRDERKRNHTALITDMIKHSLSRSGDKILYYEIISNKSKAIKRKNEIDNMSAKDINRLIKSVNPERLDVGFILSVNFLNELV